MDAFRFRIVALRNEKGSYSLKQKEMMMLSIVALRNEKGSYSISRAITSPSRIVALRNEEIIAFQTAFRPSSASNTKNIASATAISTAVSTIARA